MLGYTQPHHMDDLKNLITERLRQDQPNKRLHSAAHVLADDISTAFGEKKRFAMYLGVINRVGVENARRIFRQLQQEGKGELGKLFMYLCRKEPKKDESHPE
jgi:hypothetical protein